MFNSSTASQQTPKAIHQAPPQTHRHTRNQGLESATWLMACGLPKSNLLQAQASLVLAWRRRRTGAGGRIQNTGYAYHSTVHRTGIIREPYKGECLSLFKLTLVPPSFSLPKRDSILLWESPSKRGTAFSQIMHLLGR